MRNYQLTLVLSATLKDADRKKVTEGIKDLFKGGKFGKEEDWGEKELAYKIRRQEKGYYLNYLLEAEGVPEDFERKLNANENVLRYLLLKTK